MKRYLEAAILWLHHYAHDAAALLRDINRGLVVLNREVLARLKSKAIARKNAVQKSITYAAYTLHKLSKRGRTWQALIADVARLRNEVAAHKQTISVLRNRRFQDQDLILGLLRLHETEALNNLSSHPAVAKIVALSLATALLKTQTEVKKIYGE